MTDTLLPALIVFGGLLAIALIGFAGSSAAAARFNGSSHRSNLTHAGLGNAPQPYDNVSR